MKISIDIKSLLILSFTFILFTIIGTVSHEYGHIIVAKHFGYETFLHYGSMNCNSELNEKLKEIYIQNKTEIENDNYFVQKNEYDSGVKKLQSNRLKITIGGPLQTTLTGSFGLIILFFRRKKIKMYGLKIIDWTAVFLSLFWLREVFNVVMSIGSEVISPNGNYFGGDEKKYRTH